MGWHNSGKNLFTWGVANVLCLLPPLTNKNVQPCEKIVYYVSNLLFQHIGTKAIVYIQFLKILKILYYIGKCMSDVIIATFNLTIIKYLNRYSIILLKM